MEKRIIDNALEICFSKKGSIDFDYLMFILYDNLKCMGTINMSYNKFDDDWKESDGRYKNNNIDLVKSYYNVSNSFPGIEEVHSVELDESALFSDSFVIVRDEYWCCKLFITENYNDDIVPYLIKNSKNNIKYFDGKRFKWVNIKSISFEDIKDNYNDDLPHSEIEKFLENEESGLCLLHGIPGTGKTYYIRSLISKSSYNFIVCSSQNFPSIVTETDDLENSILVIEDCEKLLKDRNSNIFSDGISDLLNMSDGLLGDSLKLRIICTFNSDLRNIDKALLRKGRTKIKYEFKELSSDKAEALKKKLGKESCKSNVLCDILNDETVGITDTKVINKIGF